MDCHSDLKELPEVLAVFSTFASEFRSHTGVCACAKYHPTAPPNSFPSKRAGEMVHWVKALAAKIDGLSLLPGTRSVGENLPRSCPLTSTHTNK